MRIPWILPIFAALLCTAAPGAVRAQSDPDNLAVVAFVRAGVSSAPTDFISLRGPTVAADQFQAQLTFDTPLTKCFVWDLSLASGWTLSCHSTARLDTQDHLMGKVAALIGGALPAGFSANGKHAPSDGNGPYEKWTGPNDVEVQLWVLPEEGGQGFYYYEIAVVHVSP